MTDITGKPTGGDANSVEVSMEKPANNASGEAVDVYGDVQTAQEFGYVQRGLKSRHIQFIAIGGSIGTGLFLGIGGAFLKAGPLSVLLGFSITGVAVYCMMTCLGEMTTWLPLPGAIPQYCARYVDPAMGFAVGWNIWYLSSIAVCAEIIAATVLIQFWDSAISPAVWISILIALILVLNIFAVSIYGEAEFVFASIKILAIIGLLLMSFIVNLGGSPTGDRLGFRYWYDPGPPMKEVVATGDAGRFLGLISTLIFAAFSYGGVEMVATAAGEAVDPRKNMPRAIKRLIWRIIIFYVLGSLAIGTLVRSDDEQLGGASPWVLAAYNAQIPVLPSIINAVIVSSAASSANASLFVGSRYLFGLAQNKQAPRIFLKCTKSGIPIYGVGFTAIWSGLAYMCLSAESTTVFGWFISLGTVAVLFTWCSICVAYLRFRQALVRQNVDRANLPYKSRFQPWAAWFPLCYFGAIILLNGWEVFTKDRWSVEIFLTSYIGIPIYFGTYLLWKVWKRTSLVDPAEADIWSGKAALDAMEWPERISRNMVERLWNKIV
ncbi:uncharacterized protein LTR77_008320 [Saxophila tyrrhenica]|uniref:Amino acid permease/ SLC12A domain-containing protein n=1 Tax=Saxophila tyrrhenica TaxID=1690608 RepID=A0AAV9P0J9_9PEZI|nr:hypothetical protein LTR77_008320 [Saxophila tyrrhenica]